MNEDYNRRDIERYPESKRERFLSPKELQRLGQALTAAEVSETENKYAVAAFRILLLTGCRLSEIQTLEWRHVDVNEKELRLPDSKTGAKTVHLGEAAVALLEALPRVTGNPYVIVGKKEKTHLTDLQPTMPSADDHGYKATNPDQQARLFSAREASSKSSSRVFGSITTFSRTVANIFVVA